MTYTNTYQWGAISSQITQLTQGVIQSLSRVDKYTIEDYVKVLEDPLAYRCVEIIALRATNSFGKYTNNNEEIKSFILEQLDNIMGTIEDLVTQLSSAKALGFSCAEIIFDNWELKGFNVLDPRRTYFKGSKGKIDYVIYKDGIQEVWIPYNKCIHIVNLDTVSFNEKKAYGNPECKKALPYIKLKQAMMADMGVSAKTLATGILFGQADSNQSVQQFDNQGRPIGKPKSAIDALAEQISQLENHSHIVTDKNNIVTALQIPAGEQFWSITFQIVKTEILRAFGINDLIFSEGSSALPTATLGQLHFSVLDATIKRIVNQIRDQLLEKVVKQLIIWHFGKQKNYGKFEVETQEDPTQKSMRFNNMLTAISSGVLQASDPNVVNAILSDLGLPLKSPEDIQYETAMAQQQSAAQGSMEGEEQYP